MKGGGGSGRARRVLRALGFALAVPVAALLLLVALLSSDEWLPHLPWSLEKRALASLGRASDVTLLSIDDPVSSEAAPALETADASARCPSPSGMVGHGIVGCVSLSPADRAKVESALDAWIVDRPVYSEAVTACAPVYRHALSWTEDGRRFDLLLCFFCGHYTILVDGHAPWWESRKGPFGPGSEEDFNALLRAAGIRYFDETTFEWVDPLAPSGA